MKQLLALLLLLIVATSVQAADDIWGGAVSSSWTTGGNWSLGTAPFANPLNELDTLNEQAKITGTQGVTRFPVIVDGDNITAYRVFVGSAVYGELTIDGGTLNTLGYMTAAYNTADVAVINMNGGTVNIGINNSNNGHFYMGRNGTTTLNMEGGLLNIGRDLNVAQYAPANSTINLSGGTIIATTLKRTGTAHIDISGAGKLQLRGLNSTDMTDYNTVLTWIDNGWLTVNGADTDYSVVSFDPVTFVTTVTPEPATICLLGLGALSLIRRK